MIAHRWLVCITLLLWGLFPGLPLITQTHAQSITRPNPCETPCQAPQPANPSAPVGSVARRLAFDRYRFLQRLAKKLGTFPLYMDAGESDLKAIFPVGRSDRVYLFFDGAFWPDQRLSETISCYQDYGGKDKLVYRIYLADRESPAKKIARVSSLQDYIDSEGLTAGAENGHEHDEGYAVKGKLSQYATTDLAARREYVEYRYVSMEDVLQVWLLSDLKDGYSSKMTIYEENSLDPKTQTQYPSRFYKKYGLPVSQEELALISAANQSTTGAKADTSASQDQSSDQKSQNANRLTTSEMERGKSIALARYRLLKQAAEKLGIFPLDSMVGDYAMYVFFPAGRSDRMYLDLIDAFVPNGGNSDYEVLCYEEKEGKAKLVYRTKIESKDRVVPSDEPASTNTKYSSLLEYITQASEYGEGNATHLLSYYLPRTTRAFVRNDLARRRDYVQYRHYSIIDALYVCLLSDYRGGDPPDIPHMAQYYLDEDPWTGAKLKDGELQKNGDFDYVPNGDQDFYKKYGLPVARGELSLIPNAAH